MSKKTIWQGWLLTVLALPLVAVASYSNNELTQQFIDEMVLEEGFDRAELQQLFSQVEKKQSIIDAMERPAERTLTWGGYRNIFLKESRINGGAKFWRENEAALSAAQSKYGIPSEIIVAIIGVETLYGGNTGSYRVMDALSTLAFDYPKRAPFFRSELGHFLILAREQGQSPLDLKGSYAGAMGLGQFMPSSYRAYAADYDEDGFIDIWTNRSDAIWSVGNYLKHHGWKAGERITGKAQVADQYDSGVFNQGLKPELTLAELSQVGVTPVSDDIVSAADGVYSVATAMLLEGADGDEFWLGMHNFYVITRYNHSKLYAMAVFQLAEEIRGSYESL